MGRAYQNRKESMAKTSDAKAKVYSKFSREIYVCAKSGGVELEGNLALLGLIERAKKAQVPAHVIDKALDKAKGGGGEDFSPARYEGFGPGGCMVIVECLTDNPNRTFGDVRNCFNKTKCKIGSQGSVSHMFDHSAIFVFAGDDEDAVLEALMMEDVRLVGEAPYRFTQIAAGPQGQTVVYEGLDLEVDEIQFVPQNMSPVSEDDMPMFEKFIDMLEDLDDVQNIYHNAEV